MTNFKNNTLNFNSQIFRKLFKRETIICFLNYNKGIFCPHFFTKLLHQVHKAKLKHKEPRERMM